MLVHELSENAILRYGLNNVPFFFKAICSCRNGGVCIAPNLCRCSSGYEGNSCQTRKTIFFKHIVYNRFNWKPKNTILSNYLC